MTLTPDERAIVEKYLAERESERQAERVRLSALIGATITGVAPAFYESNGEVTELALVLSDGRTLDIVGHDGGDDGAYLSIGIVNPGEAIR